MALARVDEGKELLTFVHVSACAAAVATTKSSNKMHSSAMSFPYTVISDCHGLSLSLSLCLVLEGTTTT